VIAALKERFPEIIGPKKDDICYATQNRQDAVKQLARNSEVVLVVGSRSSSNSNRLREVAELIGSRAYLVDQAEQIDPAWLAGASRVGVTAGASAPEEMTWCQELQSSIACRLATGGRWTRSTAPRKT
jgi:4-hydroxy-3-methylbut-2-enyl diphosphate reductase